MIYKHSYIHRSLIACPFSNNLSLKTRQILGYIGVLKTQLDLFSPITYRWSAKLLASVLTIYCNQRLNVVWNHNSLSINVQSKSGTSCRYTNVGMTVRMSYEVQARLPHVFISSVSVFCLWIVVHILWRNNTSSDPLAGCLYTFSCFYNWRAIKNNIYIYSTKTTRWTTKYIYIYIYTYMYLFMHCIHLYYKSIHIYTYSCRQWCNYSL